MRKLIHLFLILKSYGFSQYSGWSGESGGSAKLSGNNVFTGVNRFDTPLNIRSTTSPQLRLTHTVGADSVTFEVNADGDLIIIASSGEVGFGVTPVAGQELYVFKNHNSSTDIMANNTNTGTGTSAQLLASNESSSGSSIRVMALGRSYTTNGSYRQDAGLLETGTGMSGGLNISSRGSGTPIRFYAGGFPDTFIRLILDDSGVAFPPNVASNAVTDSVADDGAITVTNGIQRVAGIDADAVLDTDPAVNDGFADGQLVIIQGTADGNTVTIADNVNTQLDGGANFTLGDGDTIQLMWDSNYSMWIEISRSNN